MSILVTGCAGFIGSNVSRLLLEAGHVVLGLDNLNDAYSVRLKRWRLSRLESQPGFSFHEIDISDYRATRPVFKPAGSSAGDGVSAVINLGARAGVRYSVENPWAYYEANTLGTLNLLELCREFGVRKFVLASTSTVYGAQPPGPFKEDAHSSRPLTPYAASKKAAETLLYSFHHLHGLDATVLRYFTVYGPAGRPDMSIFRFVRGITEREPITVFGDGTQQRDFTYVDDVARGTVLAVRPLGYETINIGNDRPIVLNDVIAMIERSVGEEARIEYKEMHAADAMFNWADVSSAGKLLDWSPTVGIEDGVQRTVNWYKENRDWAKYLV
ncbi:MAG: NAD-dependent epimerase/dehydratase family protein [Chloroflexi bacterium]|nr:NAD-dependent epimerase/dehydratase family protein [Chloroflexota bacterium]